MKRTYMKPDMKVVKLQHKCQLLTGSSQVTSVSSNLGGDDAFIWGEGSDKDAR
jgi:hypothetical protein